MSPRKAFGYLLLLTIASSAWSAKNTVLDTLAAKLRYVRSLDVEEKTNLVCPKNLKDLHGLAMPVVLAALLEPDFKQDKLEWSYFLTSPRRPLVKSKSENEESVQVTGGGGFPIVTIYFSHQETVERVKCSYAR